jgi:serine protease Do
MRSRIWFAGIVLVMFSFTAATAAEDEKEQQSKSKKQGWLGVAIQDVTPKLARDKELKVKEGAYITEVVEESPAEEAGLKQGDVVTEFNNKKIEISEDLTQIVRETAPDTKVNVKVNRKGESKTIAVTVGKQKRTSAFSLRVPHAPRVVVNMFGRVEGLELIDLERQLAEYFETPNGRGVLVKDVKRKSNAEKAGFKAGDVITMIGKESVYDTDDVRDYLADFKEGESAPVEVIRKGKKTSLKLEISEQLHGDNRIFWRGDAPEEFRFQHGKEMEQMHKELNLQLKRIPDVEREIEKVRILRKIDEV